MTAIGREPRVSPSPKAPAVDLNREGASETKPTTRMVSSRSAPPHKARHTVGAPQAQGAGQLPWEQALNNFPIWEQAKGAWGRAGLRPAKPPDGLPWLRSWGLALRAATPGTLTLWKPGSDFWPVPQRRDRRPATKPRRHRAANAPVMTALQPVGVRVVVLPHRHQQRVHLQTRQLPRLARRRIRSVAPRPAHQPLRRSAIPTPNPRTCRGTVSLGDRLTIPISGRATKQARPVQEEFPSWPSLAQAPRRQVPRVRPISLNKLNSHRY